MLRLYSFHRSGNCYKIRLLLALLDLPYETVEVDILASTGRPDEFVRKHPCGTRVPLLQLDDGSCLAESGAILLYLADGTPWLPDDRLDRARALQWMFFEQNQLEPSIANLRYWTTVRRQPEQRAAQLPLWRAQGKSALDVMEKHLDGADWFVSDRPSVADLALYGYTHVAGEGGIELGSYPRIRSWLERIRALPGHVDLG